FRFYFVDVVLEDFGFAPVVRIDLDLKRVEIIGELALPPAAEAGADHSAACEELEIARHFRWSSDRRRPSWFRVSKSPDQPYERFQPVRLFKPRHYSHSPPRRRSPSL